MAPLRLLSGVVVAASSIAFIVCVVVLLIGINHGFIQQSRTCAQYAPSSDCGLKQ